jgi:hypothetical protein
MLTLPSVERPWTKPLREAEREDRPALVGVSAVAGLETAPGESIEVIVPPTFVENRAYQQPVTQ